MSGSSSRKHLSRREFLTLGAATAAVVLSRRVAASAELQSRPRTPAAAPTQAAPGGADPDTRSPGAGGKRRAGRAHGRADPGGAQPASRHAGRAVKRGGTLTVAKPTPMREFDPFQVGPGHYTWIRAFWNTPVRYDAQLSPSRSLPNPGSSARITSR